MASLNSALGQDGDMAFSRWVSRINPEQLSAGEVFYSQNGRMDNDRSWQARLGMNKFSPALDVNPTLAFPFDYDDEDGPDYDNTTINGVYGAGYFINPDTGQDYMLIATNLNAIAINMADGSTVDVDYPAEGVISDNVEVLQALDKVFIFIEGDTAWYFDGVTEGTPAFAEVATSATAITVDGGANNAVSVAGLVTITSTGHGRETGQIITVYDGGGSGISEGDTFEITVAEDEVDEYTFYAEIPDGTYTMSIGGKQPVGGGYIPMPDPGWAVFNQGRLIVPYGRELENGITRDEIIFSDIFDSDTFDPILNQLRLASGGADYVVGAAPLLDDRLIVFCRRSVHVVSGVSGSLQDMTVTEITREVGCISRKSIVEVGGSIMFLSDQGVYTVSYGQELNLIANAIPLSEPIENYVRLINWKYADKAVAAYVDNRYFLAVPIGFSRINNAMLVYNFLNQGWESIDTFPDGFDIYKLLVAPIDGRNNLFLVNAVGAVHRYDAQPDYDICEIEQGLSVSEPISGKMITRRFILGTTDLKKFLRAKTLAESRQTLSDTNLPDKFKRPSTGQTSSLSISFSATDPDTVSPEFVPIETVDILDGEDYTINSSVRKRGYGLQLQYETTGAKVRGCVVEGTLSSRANVNRS